MQIQYVKGTIKILNIGRLFCIASGSENFPKFESDMDTATQSSPNRKDKHPKGGEGDRACIKNFRELRLGVGSVDYHTLLNFGTISNLESIFELRRKNTEVP